MRKQFLWAVLLLGTAGIAQAAEYPQVLTTKLTKPARAWINIEDCKEPDQVELSISWSVPKTAPAWTAEQIADVFLASGDTCASAAVEIRKDAATGDVKIQQSVTSGEFPPEGDPLTLAEVKGLDCASTTAENDYYFCIRWKWEDPYNVNATYVYRGGAPLRFDVKAPGAVELKAAYPGEKNVKLEWANPADEDLAGFILYYRVEGTTEWSHKTVAEPAKKGERVTGLVNGTTYEFTVAAYDKAENEGPASNVKTASPQPVDDFFEYYKENGGHEQGGFCFVATAAYGSYGNSMVLPLRLFRDRVLGQSELGRTFISSYYQYGPRWARAIRGSELHRAVARWALLPAVAFAWASELLSPAGWLVLLLSLVLVVLLGRRLWRARRGVLVRSPAAGLLALMLFCFSGTAQGAEVPNYQMQLRFGPYYPAVDSEKGVTGEPFDTIFGGDDALLFELGVDYEIFRGFGVVTAGGSFGFAQFLGKGRVLDGSTGSWSESTDTTVFNLVPLRLSLGYHLDLVAERVGIPLVPYVCGGLSYYIWWITDGVGDVASWKDANGKTQDASGGIFGYHLSLGIKLLLDALDEESAQNLENNAGIINSYLFGEYTSSWVNDFGSGKHFNLGDETVMFGLMMEF